MATNEYLWYVQGPDGREVVSWRGITTATAVTAEQDGPDVTLYHETTAVQRGQSTTDDLTLYRVDANDKTAQPRAFKVRTRED